MSSYVVLLVCMAFTMVCAKVDNDRFLGNVGVYLEDSGTIVFSKAYWHHTFVIELPKVDDIKSFFFLCHSWEKRLLCARQEIHPMQSFIKQLDTDMVNSIKELTTFVSRNLQSFSGSRRKPRSAIFSFIGSLSKSLFGTATVEDLERVAHRVNSMIQQDINLTNAINVERKNFESFMQLENVRYESMKNIINDTRKNLKGLTNRLGSLQKEFLDAQRMMAASFVVQNISYSFQQHIADIRHAITLLTRGYLSNLLISDQQLQSGLRKIAANAESTHLEYLQHADVAYHRRHGSYIARVHRETGNIWVTLKVAVGPRTQDRLFRVHSFAVPIGKNPRHGTIITRLPEYIIDRQFEDQHAYAAIKSDLLSTHCKRMGRFHHDCEGMLGWDKRPQSCIAGILKDDIRIIGKYCTHRFLGNEFTTATPLKVLAENNILVVNRKTLRIQCGRKMTDIRGCVHCRIKIPCNCRIVDGDSVIDAGSSLECNNVDQSIMEYSHLFNLLVSKDYDAIIAKASQDWSNGMEHLNVLPNAEFHDDKYEELLSVDKEDELHARQVRDRVKEDEEVFSKLADAILTGAIVLPDDWSSPFSILLLISIALIGISIPLVVKGYIGMYRRISQYVEEHEEDISTTNAEESDNSSETDNMSETHVKNYSACRS